MTLHSLTLEERFWAKVKKTEGCWNWIAGKSHGYGLFNVSRGKKVGAHRFSYELAHEPLAPGVFVDHTCHNAACVNPRHLRAVSPKQNSENRLGATRASKSGVRGVYWNAKAGKYQASVTHQGESHFVGLFADLAKANAAVVEKRLELHTHNDADRIPA